MALLAWLGEPLPRDILQQQLESESSSKVTKAIQDLLAPSAPQADQVALADLVINLPPLPPIPMNDPAPADLASQLKEIHVANFMKADARYRENKAKGRLWSQAQPYQVGSDWYRGAIEALSSLDQFHKFMAKRAGGWVVGTKGLNLVVQRPDMNLVHVVRLLLCTGLIQRNEDAVRTITWPARELLRLYYSSHKDEMDMRYLAAVLEAHGIDDEVLGKEYLSGLFSIFAQMEIGTIWPYFAERVVLLEEVFATKQASDYRYTERRSLAFEVLATMPCIPPKLVPMMWEIALGTGKSERRAAQKCLHRVLDRDVRIIQALASGQQEVRAAVAGWLGELRVRSAIEPLKIALRKEKSEIAKTALMSALEQLGEPIEEFLDRKVLVREAKAGLAKGVPAALSWIQLELIPQMRWQDTGKPVDREILAWLLVKACKVGSPEPSPMLRRYAQWFVRDDAERFGQWVLENWLGKDVIPRPREEAIALARQHAQSLARFMKDKTEDDLMQAALPSYLQEPAGSAIKEKGVLAVAGACCGPAAAAPVEHYLKTWYGRHGAVQSPAPDAFVGGTSIGNPTGSIDCGSFPNGRDSQRG